MLISAICYILGLAAFFGELEIQISAILVLCLILLLIKNIISPKLALVWVFMFFFAFFNAYFRIKTYDELSHFAPNSATIRGQVISIPDITLRKRERFFFNVHEIIINDISHKVSSKTFVYVQDNPEINIGDFYEIKGSLRKPMPVSNPSQFDYGKYLRNYRTHTTFYAQDFNKIDGKLTPKWKILQGLNNKRKVILKFHSKNIKSPNIEILGGVVFGDDAVSPPDDIKQTFINSGILHILAASGMNVALIYGIFFFILNTLRVPYKINNILGIFIVILYTLMTGMGPSVIRASIILIFILVGKLLDREAHNISLLSLVAILMLIYNPAFINDVGFQLSFIVTFGLLFMANPLLLRLKLMNFNSIIASTIVIPLIAQLWVAPIQMFYFNTFCVYSVLTNILIMPFITIISFAGFISSSLALITPLANFVCTVFDFILNPVISCLVFISNFFANLPHALITMPKPTFIQIFLYYIGLIIATKIIKTGFNKKLVISIFSIALIILLSSIKFATPSEIIFFDVQNADCFLYKTNSNKYFIIDTGKKGFNGNKNQVQYILAKYLKDKGVKRIEALILTHFDSDHSGGAIDLIKDFKIKKVYVNSLTDDSKIAKGVYSQVLSPVVKAENNQTIYFENNIEIKTFMADFKQEKYENENSIITLINDNGFKILLMGDAGIIAYNKLKDYLPESIDVLKVGHHGAKDVTDKTMISELSPKYSIISTGPNKYGHPNKATLKILSSSKILRTDKNNAILIKNKEVYVFDTKKNWTILNY